MTTEFVFGGIGVLISLAEAYLPKFKDWYKAKSDQTKQLLNLLFAAIIVAGAYVLSYFGYYDAFTPDIDGVVEALKLFVAVLIGNAGAFVTLNKIYKKEK